MYISLKYEKALEKNPRPSEKPKNPRLDRKPMILGENPRSGKADYCFRFCAASKASKWQLSPTNRTYTQNYQPVEGIDAFIAHGVKIKKVS